MKFQAVTGVPKHQDRSLILTLPSWWSFTGFFHRSLAHRESPGHMMDLHVDTCWKEVFGVLTQGSTRSDLYKFRLTLDTWWVLLDSPATAFLQNLYVDFRGWKKKVTRSFFLLANWYIYLSTWFRVGIACTCLLVILSMPLCWCWIWLGQLSLLSLCFKLASSLISVAMGNTCSAPVSTSGAHFLPLHVSEALCFASLCSLYNMHIYIFI